MTEIRQAIAPHVEPGWVEGMLLELRLQGVSGEQIGAALAEVEAHVVDSGQGAQEAFGDPVEYARSLGLPPSPEQSRAATLKSSVPVLIQLFGMVCVSAAMPWGVAAVGVAPSLLAGLVLAGLLPVVGIAFGDQLLRAIVEHPVVVFVVTLVALGAVSGGLVALSRLGLDQPLFDLPRPVVLLAGLIALAVGTWAAVRSDAEVPDVVSSPVPGSAMPRPGVRHWAWTALPIPVAAVAIVLLITLI
ncbi:MAG: hypothetical protein QM582_03975 [Micropruina sp.]|uniref:hypothetical protein n=1 Tax=Micropruina sp. TaxID=2737536 RepID=UPI0039E61E8F